MLKELIAAEAKGGGLGIRLARNVGLVEEEHGSQHQKEGSFVLFIVKFTMPFTVKNDQHGTRT